MLRLILILIWTLLTLVILGIPVLLFLWILGLFNRPLRKKMGQAYVSFIARGITSFAGARIVTAGLENIPTEEGMLVISNHRSMFDILSTYPLFKGPCASVSKIEWKRIPFLKQLMDTMDCVFLDRSNLRAGLKAAAQMETLLKAGTSVWICPEGTRNQKQEMLPFHEGSFRAAFQTGARILPLTIVHTDDLFEQHRPYVRPATVTLHFGEPIPTQGLSKQEQRALITRVRDQIQANYEKLY